MSIRNLAYSAALILCFVIPSANSAVITIEVDGFVEHAHSIYAPLVSAGDEMTATFTFDPTSVTNSYTHNSGWRNHVLSVLDYRVSMGDVIATGSGGRADVWGNLPGRDQIFLWSAGSPVSAPALEELHDINWLRVGLTLYPIDELSSSNLPTSFSVDSYDLTLAIYMRLVGGNGREHIMGGRISNASFFSVPAPAPMMLFGLGLFGVGFRLINRLVLKNLVNVLVAVCAIGMASGASAGIITVHMEGQITRFHYGASGPLGTAVSMTATLDLSGNGRSYCRDSGYSCDGHGDDYPEVIVGFEVHIDGNTFISNGYHSSLSIRQPSSDPNFPVYQYNIRRYTTGPDLFGYEVDGFEFTIFSTQLPGYTYLTTPPPGPVDSSSQFYYGADFCGYFLDGPPGSRVCGDISTVAVNAQGVPAPAPMMLFGLGLFGLRLVSKKAKRAA